MPSELTAAIANEFISAKTAQRDFVEEIIRRYDATAVSHIQQLAENIRHKVRKYGDTNSADDFNVNRRKFSNSGGKRLKLNVSWHLQENLMSHIPLNYLNQSENYVRR